MTPHRLQTSNGRKLSGCQVPPRQVVRSRKTTKMNRMLLRFRRLLQHHLIALNSVTRTLTVVRPAQHVSVCPRWGCALRMLVICLRFRLLWTPIVKCTENSRKPNRPVAARDDPLASEASTCHPKDLGYHLC
jgi:hypothetical protein